MHLEISLIRSYKDKATILMAEKMIPSIGGVELHNASIFTGINNPFDIQANRFDIPACRILSSGDCLTEGKSRVLFSGYQKFKRQRVSYSKPFHEDPHARDLEKVLCLTYHANGGRNTHQEFRNYIDMIKTNYRSIDEIQFELLSILFKTDNNFFPRLNERPSYYNSRIIKI